MTSEESPTQFLARLRKKARDNKDKLSYAEKVLLEVVDKAEEKSILGSGRSSKL